MHIEVDEAEQAKAYALEDAKHAMVSDLQSANRAASAIKWRLKGQTKGPTKSMPSEALQALLKGYGILLGMFGEATTLAEQALHEAALKAVTDDVRPAE